MSNPENLWIKLGHMGFRCFFQNDRNHVVLLNTQMNKEPWLGCSCDTGCNRGLVDLLCDQLLDAFTMLLGFQFIGKLQTLFHACGWSFRFFYICCLAGSCALSILLYGLKSTLDSISILWKFCSFSDCPLFLWRVQILESVFWVLVRCIIAMMPML